LQSDEDREQAAPAVERRAYLPEWLHRYNWHRPHSALAGRPPITRLSVEADNLMRLHT